MALTALEIKEKTFKVKFRGYSEEEVNEFLDVLVDDYEELVRVNREQENRIKTLEEKLAYFDDMKESLSQSVILAQETAEKVKTTAQTEATNLVGKATNDSERLLEEAKLKANQILRDATDEAKVVAIETEDLKRQSRVFHQRLLAAIEAQHSLMMSPEWSELLQPTAVYLQNSTAAFKEVVESVLQEQIPETTDENSLDATRQFTPDEIAELQRRMEESNQQLEAAQAEEKKAEQDVKTETEDFRATAGETQTFKLNIAD
ncbi:DivIVA domain-containing protein [Streptococcus cuniculipharyngis]|uniref:DivIVA domain-containing protein n=1 Tax=Streptococcus cuniculipharyngis TaxID=1562651 RepID=A0A5C5SCB4_9STRE|nr:DivIVA domain-containing protein [Streptococcus cuniculipharyngis]TWS96930.1 DivIVA domain-containing protein [Streptococcus cuniculipharyngis]